MLRQGDPQHPYMSAKAFLMAAGEGPQTPRGWAALKTFLHWRLRAGGLKHLHCTSSGCDTVVIWGGRTHAQHTGTESAQCTVSENLLYILFSS